MERFLSIMGRFLPIMVFPILTTAKYRSPLWSMAKKTESGSAFILSDESINSYGYRIKTAGIDTSIFESNPVMLLEHDSLNLIGRWNDLRIKGAQLLADPEFDTDDELATKTSKRVEKGYLRGVSVGLQILEVGEERTAEGAIVPVVTKSQLLEASLCALPSNSNALRLYNKAGQLMNEQEARLSLQTLKQQTHKQNHTDVNLTAKNLETLGLAADCTDETLINERVQKLATDLKEFKETQEAKLKADVGAYVDEKIKSGQLNAAKRDKFVELGVTDFEGLKDIVDDKPAPTKPNELLNRTNGKAGAAGREDWSYDDWRKKDPVGLLTIKRDTPEEYKELLTASNIVKHF